jgi:hypothetical protein
MIVLVSHVKFSPALCAAARSQRPPDSELNSCALPVDLQGMPVTAEQMTAAAHRERLHKPFVEFELHRVA